jgi:nucleotide-binding universal stress UspA family protein
MAYHNILVPLDGSELSFYALREAARIGKSKGTSTAIAIHVIPKTAKQVHAFGRGDLRDAFDREGRKILETASDIAKRSGISLAVRMAEGIPYEKIIETARLIESELIVMGSHGRTLPHKILIGSCTRRVLEGAPCPVLVIKEPVR